MQKKFRNEKIVRLENRRKPTFLIALAKSTIILKIIPVSAKSFSMYGSSAQITRMAKPGPNKPIHKTYMKHSQYHKSNSY